MVSGCSTPDASRKKAAVSGSFGRDALGLMPASEPTHPHKIMTALKRGEISTSKYVKTTTKSSAVAAPLQAAQTEQPQSQKVKQTKNQEGITVRIGVFFDGTGSDAYNIIAREQCQNHQQMAKAEECEKVNDWVQEDNSYSNGFTNVYRLWNAYQTDHKKNIRSVYVAGVGTKAWKADITFPDEALGIGVRGVVAKVEHGIQKIEATLKSIQARWNTLVLDVFGFSRGAAAARHFANEVYKGIRGEQSVFYDVLEITSENVEVKINFIGLFDTVAAVGNLENGFDVASASNPGINLYLPKDIATKIFQFRAMNEYRENFASNSVQPEHQEVGIYGAHSDVGGGYLEMGAGGDTKAERSNVMAPCTVIKSHEERAWQKIKAAEQMYSAYPKSISAFHPTFSEYEEPNTISTKMDIDHDWAPATYQMRTYLNVMTRVVMNGLQLVVGRLMHDVALKYGVPMKGMHDVIPNALIEIYESFQTQLANIGEASVDLSLDQPTEAFLYHHYIHCSANWNPLLKPLPLYVNKPYIKDNHLARHVYKNVPQSGYPVAMHLPAGFTDSHV